jgi:hypothetical protein
MYSRALLYIPSTIRVATKSQSRSLSTFNFTSRRDVVPSTLWSIRNFSDAAVSVASSDASPSQIQELSSSLDADVKKAEGRMSNRSHSSATFILKTNYY